MIVLGLPAVSLPGNLKGDSGFLEIYRPMKAMSERFPLWGQVHVPNQASEEVCASFSTPRIKVVRNGGGLWDKWFPDLHKFSVMFCKDPIDLVFTQQKSLAHMLHATLNDHRLDGPTVPIIMDVLKVGLRGKTHDLVTENSEMEEAVAMLFAQPVVSTLREKELAVRLCRKILSPAMVHKVIAHTHLVPDAIGDGALLPAASEKREGPLTVALVGRMNSNKRYMKAMEIADLAFKMGTPIKLLVITNTRQGGPIGRLQLAHPHVDVLHDIGKEEFIRRLSTIDIVMNASHEEGYCVSVAELLASGKMMVLPDREWVHALAGADYPFIYKTTLEAIVHIQWLVKNLGSEKVRQTRVAMRERFTGDTESIAAGRLWDIFESALVPVNVTIGSRFTDQRATALEVLAALGDRFTYDDFRHEYLKGRNSKALKSQRGTAGDWYLYKWIRQAGFDIEEYATMTFARRAE